MLNFGVMMNRFNADIVHVFVGCELRDIQCWIPGKVEELYSFLPTG
jgi:hypothetical protein